MIRYPLSATIMELENVKNVENDLLIETFDIRNLEKPIFHMI